MAVPGHPADRDPDCRAVRGQPAFPDRAGRHDQFRPRRLAAGAYGARCCSSSARCRWRPRCCWGRGAGRAGVRLVLRAPVRRLPGHADAGRGADPVGHRLPVGRRHRRQQRTHRPVARRLAEQRSRLLLPDLALCALGVWWLRRLAFARARARLGPAPKRWHGHAPRNGRASWPPRWPPAWPVRCTPFSGSIAPDAMAVGRSVDGLVMRCCSAGCNRWPVRWRGGLYLAAGRSRAQHRILARAAGLAILALVMAFPDGLGAAARWTRRLSLRSAAK